MTLIQAASTSVVPESAPVDDESGREQQEYDEERRLIATGVETTL